LPRTFSWREAYLIFNQRERYAMKKCWVTWKMMVGGPKISLWLLKILFVPHRKHITSPLRSPTG
jgi:hypothetical protein